MLCFKYLIKRAPRRRRLARRRRCLAVCRPRKRCRPCNICEPAKAARERAENGKGTKSGIRRKREKRQRPPPGQLGLVGAGRRKKGLDWLSPPLPPSPICDGLAFPKPQKRPLREATARRRLSSLFPANISDATRNRLPPHRKTKIDGESSIVKSPRIHHLHPDPIGLEYQRLLEEGGGESSERGGDRLWRVGEGRRVAANPAAAFQRPENAGALSDV